MTRTSAVLAAALVVIGLTPAAAFAGPVGATAHKSLPTVRSVPGRTFDPSTEGNAPAPGRTLDPSTEGH